MTFETVNSVNNRPKRKNDDIRFMLLVAIAFLLTIGVVFALFGTAYIQDMETLRNLPNLIWSFACGQPVENNVTLPLLFSVSIVSFLGSGILAGWRWWLKRRHRPAA